MANRILRWCIYTLIFALLPTLISLLFSVLFDLKLKNYSTELIFFVIMICATSLSDINDAKKYIKKDFVFNLFFGFCMIGIITTSVLYGGIALIDMGMVDILDSAIMQNIKGISIILSIISAIIGLIIQIILYRTEVSA